MDRKVLDASLLTPKSQRLPTGSYRAVRLTNGGDPSRRRSQAEWKSIKDTMRNLYVTEKRSLEEVMAILAWDFGFRPSEKDIRARTAHWTILERHGGNGPQSPESHHQHYEDAMQESAAPDFLRASHLTQSSQHAGDGIVQGPSPRVGEVTVPSFRCRKVSGDTIAEERIEMSFEEQGSLREINPTIRGQHRTTTDSQLLEPSPLPNMDGLACSGHSNGDLVVPPRCLVTGTTTHNRCPILEPRSHGGQAQPDSDCAGKLCTSNAAQDGENTKGLREASSPSAVSQRSSELQRTLNGDKTSLATNASDTWSRSKRKRNWEDDEDKEDDGNRNGEGDRMPRRSRAAASVQHWSPLACPYHKYDAARYSEQNLAETNYRHCSSCLLKDISRLKQHLYRVHCKPEHYCGRCSEVFDSRDGLDLHSRQSSPCAVGLVKYDDRMTVDQTQQLKRKMRGRNVSDAWYSIYQLLFPKASLPKSPFVDGPSDDILREFMAFAERQGPSLLFESIREDSQRVLPVSPSPVDGQSTAKTTIAQAFPRLIRDLESGFRCSRALPNCKATERATPARHAQIPVGGSPSRAAVSDDSGPDLYSLIVATSGVAPAPSPASLEAQLAVFQDTLSPRTSATSAVEDAPPRSNLLTLPSDSFSNTWPPPPPQRFARLNAVPSYSNYGQTFPLPDLDTNYAFSDNMYHVDDWRAGSYVGSCL